MDAPTLIHIDTFFEETIALEISIYRKLQTSGCDIPAMADGVLNTCQRLETLHRAVKLLVNDLQAKLAQAEAAAK